MAVEEGKVKAALDVKFKGKSVSKNLKERLAKAWAPKIETDDDIEGYVNDREDVILEAAKEADQRVTDAVENTKKKAAEAVSGKADPDKQDPPADPAVPDDAPAWAKALIAQNQKLTETVQGLQQARTAETIADRFKKDERLKDVPEAWVKRAVPKDEKDFDAAVADLVADYQAFATQYNIIPAGNETPPGAAAGGGGNGKVKQASEEELKAVMANL